MAQTLIGELSLHFEGYGFVVFPKPNQADVFIPARLIGDALHGDIVEVKIKPSKKGLWEGQVVRIVERGLKQMLGRLENRGKQWFVLSDDQRVRHRMQLTAPPAGCQPEDYVVAKITQYPEGSQPLLGELLEKLPKRGNLQAEIEYVIARHQWPKIFPEKIQREAEKQRNREAETQKGLRKDLRPLPFVTIDGEDAKDFDDAVYAKSNSDGSIRLWVAIADVSHYVSAGSVLDHEAFARGTSVYFPGKVLPMLPEQLSNDLCSLRPNEDRLVLVAEMTVDPKGEVSQEDFYPAVFQSQARLTYQIVKKILEDRDPAARQQYQHLVPMLETLSQTARYLKQQRNHRGSLDFDLPEPEIILDFTGGISDIEKAERFWSHQIIEELMIAANEAVARFLTAKGVGCLYRIHEKPDPIKVRSFYQLVQRLGYNGSFPKEISGKSLQHILINFKNHPEERLVNKFLLRSMAQAVYSDQNLGHFGLTSRCYCHFTSPIRRYPDLVVHRLLKKGLKTRDQGPGTGRDLEEIAEKSSSQERKAMGAEREMLALHQTIFLKEKMGEVFIGIISHVTKFGFFVELLDYFVEGLVLKEEIGGDDYTFDEAHLALRGRNRKKVFKIGDRARILVHRVDLVERRAYFKWLDSGSKG